MSNRVLTILEHIASADEGLNEAAAALRTRLRLDSLRSQFVLSPERLREMTTFMMHEMAEGLRAGGKSTLRMLPSYVYKRDPHQANGVYYALDLGGTNFRVIRMLVRHGKLMQSSSSQFAIPKPEMHGTAEQLFDFIAKSVLKFMQSKGYLEDNQAEKSERIPLGFTFSFPVLQQGIAKGSLIKWTKGFTATGVEGHDVVRLLQLAFERQSVNMAVVALCNDTVGTLITRFFEDATAESGVILGTGSNACYWEQCQNVTKDADIAAKGDAEIVINMEFGNFDSENLLVLPRTSFDDEIDDESSNKHAQRFEKMISGMYLGEIARRILIRLARGGSLNDKVLTALKTSYGFTSRDNGLISADRTPGLIRVNEILSKHYGLHLDEPQRHIVREVARLVIHRAAQLSGMAVAATLLKTGRQDNATIAVDGSVFEKTPGFRAVMQATLKKLLGRDGADVRLVLTRDGSGFGAGFIAALAAQTAGH